jgi:hypothetical protein
MASDLTAADCRTHGREIADSDLGDHRPKAIALISAHPKAVPPSVAYGYAWIVDTPHLNTASLQFRNQDN